MDMLETLREDSVSNKNICDEAISETEAVIITQIYTICH